MRMILRLKKTIFIALLLTVNFSLAKDLSDDEKRTSELLAKDIASCAGDFEFASGVFSSSFPAYSENLKNLSRGWNLGSWFPYYSAGYQMEAAKVFAIAKKDIKINYWLAKFEGASKDETVNIMENELTPRLKHSTNMDSKVVEFQDIVRKMLLTRPKKDATSF